MNKLILAALLLTTPAWACTAFYKGESVDGLNKICYYDHLGSSMATTVASYELCPLTVEVRH